MNALKRHRGGESLSLGDFSLEDFLRRVKPKLKALFARYRIPPQDTEDILQQALLALVYRLKSVRDPEAWLMGTLRNKCLVYWRDRRRKLYDSVDATVLEWMAKPEAPQQERSDLWQDLETLLARLPSRCQSMLWLRYRMGYDTPEIARRLGYSPNSVSKVCARCLASLTRELMASGRVPDASRDDEVEGAS
jgi:RNA polymerase sigma factor (sigma-70 family)